MNRPEITHSRVADKKRLSILFVCTGNACRSQIAEGWANYLFPKSGLAAEFEFAIASAGLQTHGLNPNAVAVMQEVGVDISEHTSDLLLGQQLEQNDWVITLCDHADQYCPAIPPGVEKRHWGLPDPAQAEVGDGDALQPFRETRQQVKVAIQTFIDELQQAQLSLDNEVTALQPEFSGADVQVARNSVYRGFLEIQQLQIRHRLYKGGWSKPFQRELMVKEPAVMVLLYDPQRDAVVLIEQFRVGALQDRRSPWLLEMVAGIVEPGELLAEVAQREAQEEAGCQILELEQIMQLWMTPGGCDEQITLYCGRVDAAQAGGVHGLAEEHEDIRVKVVSVELALRALNQGLICNSASVIALQWLQLNRTTLRQRWLGAAEH